MSLRRCTDLAAKQRKGKIFISNFKYCPADSELTIFLPARSAPPVGQLADHTPANVTISGERLLVGDEERYGCLENVPDILPEIKCKRLSW